MKILIPIILSLAILVGLIWIEQTHGILGHFGYAGDEFYISVEKDLEGYISIFWVGESNQRPTRENNFRILDTIFYDSKQSKFLKKVPNQYGKNRIEVYYLRQRVSSCGHWKMSTHFSHDYHINVFKKDNYVFVDWKITGKFSEESLDSLVVE